MVPDGRRITEGTSAQLTNQLRPAATVRAWLQPVAVRSENFKVARSPVRSIQLRSTPRDDTDNCGWAALAPVGEESGWGVRAAAPCDAAVTVHEATPASTTAARMSRRWRCVMAASCGNCRRHAGLRMRRRLRDRRSSPCRRQMAR